MEPPLVALVMAALVVAALVIVTLVRAAPASASVSPAHGAATGGATVSGTTPDFGFVQISVGREHTVALTADGQAYAWGDTYYGKLGDDGPLNVYVQRPVKVAQGSLKFKKVSAGNLHSLALTTDGRIFAWGYNGSGRLGDGTTTNRRAPVAVSHGSLRFKDIAAAQGHSVALTTAGRAYSWGDNNYRRLGVDGVDLSLTPVAVSGGQTFASIWAGSDSTSSFGVTSGGQAYGWGRNVVGEIGIGSSTGVGADHKNGVITPTAVRQGGARVRKIVNHFNVTFALTTDGRVLSAGYQFGYEGPAAVPPEQHELSAVAHGSLRFTQLATGGHLLGLTADGKVYAWGNNDEGELGDGTFRTVNYTPRQVNLGGARATYVDSGSYFSLAQTVDGVVRGWGYNATRSGRLGHGAETTRELTPVSGPAWRVTDVRFGGRSILDLAATGGSWQGKTPGPETPGVVAVQVTTTLHGGSSSTGLTQVVRAGDYLYGTPAATRTALSVSGKKVVGQTQALTARVAPAAAGKVTFTNGAKVLATVAVTNGGATVKVKLPAGKHRLAASFAPTSIAHRASKTAISTVTIAKAKPTISVKAPKKVKRGKNARVTVRVSASGLTATGKVTVSVAGRKASGTLKKGKITLTVKKLRKTGAKQRVIVTYSGNASIKKATSKSAVVAVRQ